MADVVIHAEQMLIGATTIKKTSTVNVAQVSAK